MKEPRRPLFAAIGIACWVIAMAVATSTGCVIAPTEGQQVTPHVPLHIQGYALHFDLVTMELYDQCAGVWSDQDTTLASFDPSLPAGYWNNSPELHFYEMWPIMPEVCFFSRDNCPTGDYCAYMRLREDAIDGSNTSTYLYRGNDASLGCTLGQLGQGVDFYTAGFNCGYNSTVITLHSGL
ncbi:MAG TPA: hypothetical protein VIX73_16675 [Kofleriaceae bacterium]|jgi:hypothetical protein